MLSRTLRPVSLAGRRLCLLPLLLLAACGGDDPAEEAPGPAVPAVQVSHFFSHDAAVPGGAIEVLYHLKLDPQWHLYGPFLNDSGYPPSVDLELPAGWQAGALQWPAAERYLMPGEILDHVYHGELWLLQEWRIPAAAQVGETVKIPVQISWLACKDQCVPGQQALVLELPVTAGNRASSEAGRFQAVRDALPRPAPAAGLAVAKNKSEIILTVPDARELEFHPAEDCAPLQDLISDGKAAGTSLRLRLRPGADPDAPVRGILHQRLDAGAIRNWTIDIPTGG